MELMFTVNDCNCALLKEQLCSDTGQNGIQVCGLASGFDKSQCTLQTILFAIGKPCVKPFVMFLDIR